MNMMQYLVIWAMFLLNLYQDKFALDVQDSRLSFYYEVAKIDRLIKQEVHGIFIKLAILCCSDTDHRASPHSWSFISLDGVRG